MNDTFMNLLCKLKRALSEDFGKKFFFSALTVLFISTFAFSDEYSVNKSASKVKWEAKKVTGKHDGTISFDNGLLKLNGTKISGGSFVIDMNTIVVADITDPGTNKKLVGHLFSDDFFSVGKFPQSKLEIKKSELKSGDNYRFVGELTIKGITKPVEFDAKVNVSSGNLTASGVITVNRTLYDIKYRSGSFFSDLGDKMIYDDFTLEFELIADKK
jgi:polyisoprenoid-binding protein YceI